MKTPSERLLAQKALNGKLRRTESKDLLLQISKEKKRFEQIVHRRKEVVANEMRRNSPSISRLRTKKPLTAKQLRSKPGGVGGSMKVGSGDRRRSDDLMCHRKESEMGVLKLAYRVRASANQKPEVHNYEHYSGTRKGKIQQSMSMTSLVGSFGGGRHMGMTSMAANNSQRLSNNILDERENMKSRGNNGNRIRPTTAGARLNKALQYQTAQQDQARPSTSHSGTLRKDNELMRTIAEFNNTNMMKSLTVNSESLGRGGIPVRTIMVPPPRLPPGEAYPELIKFNMTHLHKLRMGYLTGEGSRSQFETMERPHTSAGRLTGDSHDGSKPVWKPHSNGAAWRMINIVKKERGVIAQ